MNSNLDIVNRALESGKAPEGRTLEALNNLAERLGRLKDSSPLFDAVAFSPAVERMLHDQTVAVS